MALTRYHNIDGSSSSVVELVPQFSGCNSIKSIVVAPLTSSGTPTVSLFIQKPIASGTDKFFIIKDKDVALKTNLVLDTEVLGITNDFSLFIQIDTGSTVDVIVNVKSE